PAQSASQKLVKLVFDDLVRWIQLEIVDLRKRSTLFEACISVTVGAYICCASLFTGNAMSGRVIER
ncbi:hypothetical protein A2U01_0113994, partial [Trifolium medium]|nr:hypothetical protein [Trifolium medium]